MEYELKTTSTEVEGLLLFIDLIAGGARLASIRSLINNKRPSLIQEVLRLLCREILFQQTRLIWKQFLSAPFMDMSCHVQQQTWTLKVHRPLYLLNICVAQNLPFPTVLGQDLLVLWDLFNSSNICNIALTRFQTRKREGFLQLLYALTFYDPDQETKRDHKL